MQAGPLAAADAVLFRLAKVLGGSTLAAFRRPWTFSNPSFFIPLVRGYPRYFIVSSGETGPGAGASAGQAAWLFEAPTPTSGWKAVDYVQLSGAGPLPPLDKTVAAPLSDSAAGPRMGLKTVSSLAEVITSELYLEFPPPALPSATCPRPAVDAGKYERLTGGFKRLLADERQNCVSFASSHLSVSFNWSTTSWPVVSLPTSSGGSLSFLVLARKSPESALNGGNLSCPSKPDPCGVFLSSARHYSTITYDEQYMLLVETSPRSSPSAPEPIDLLGSGESVSAVVGNASSPSSG